MARREVKAPVLTLDTALELWVLLGVLLGVVEEPLGVDEATVGFGVVDEIRVAMPLEPDAVELALEELMAALISDWTDELKVPVIPFRLNNKGKMQRIGPNSACEGTVVRMRVNLREFRGKAHVGIPCVRGVFER